jgi:hypothetical protein
MIMESGKQPRICALTRSDQIDSIFLSGTDELMYQIIWTKDTCGHCHYCVEDAAPHGAAALVRPPQRGGLAAAIAAR